MAPPPWWILSGVKPAGPQKDMGSWKAISFSPEQQEQFGINDSGDVLDKPKFDAAIEALKTAGPAAPAAPSEPRFKILAQGGDGRGLGVQSPGELGMCSTATHQWKVYPGGPPGWFRLSPAESKGHPLCLDLTNPGQQPQLAPEADVSGQYWKLEKVVGCKKLDGGAVARCIIGYKLSSMWTGPSRVLTAGAGVELKEDDDEPGQVWEVLDDKGELWMPSAAAPVEAAEPEPQLIACDFDGPPAEPVLIVEGLEEATLIPES